MSNSKFDTSRRNFIKNASLASLAVASPLSSILNLKTMNALMNSAPPPSTGYKALVCFFLHGGNDSYNMLMPRSTSEYMHYANTRTNMAISQAGMLPLGGVNGNYGVHPAFSDVQQMYDNGDLSFLTNVGTLVEPTNKTLYTNGSVAVPLGLFSHLDQYNHWQSARANVRTNKGWGGKVADLLASANTNTNISMNVSLAGSNIFQFGQNTIEFTIDKNGANIPTNRNSISGNHLARRSATDSIMNQSYSDVFQETYANTFSGSIDSAEQFQAAIDAVPNFVTPFAADTTSQEFEMIAKTIHARSTLGFDRQIFFVRLTGFDHHDDLLIKHAEKLTIVNDAMKSFKGALDEMGLFNDVTTFVASEFARTLTSNGDGTDHGWGGNAMVMGGDVNGGNIYGTYPSLEVGSNDYIGNGVMIPSTSADSMFAELAMWYGVPQSDLTTVFPNLGNFHTVSSLNAANPPLGFMNL
ncbi:MAG: hypothetical protein ACI9N1_000267 [Flavobacteriales bacterium]